MTLNEEDSCYLFLPLHHTYGSIYNFMYSLVFGYSVYLAGSLQNMIAEMKIVRPTAFSGVPKTYTKILEASEKYGVSIPSLFGGRMKYLFSGGAILSPELRTIYKDAGLNIMNAYGLSETSSGFCLDYPDEEDMESAGTLMEDIDAGFINCIIIKDLSRLGRDYIQMGRFLSQYFPSMGVSDTGFQQMRM